MIRIENLTKNYKDFTLQVSMEIAKGRITGLIGKNGAGKSTTIKSILGLIRPDGGSVLVMGKDVKDLSSMDRQNLGVALSDSGFSVYLTIKSIIRILKGSYTSFDEEKFRRLCKEQRLPLDKPIKDFSTGMKAKLRVLVALSHNAELLIMDEPTAGMDVEARNEILDILRDYLAEDDSRSILITSHIATDLEGLCDDLYLIDSGKVILHEETDVILSSYGILKMDKKEYETIDKSHIIAAKKDSFGYHCLTNERRYYAENYPGMVVEKSGIDDLILMMTGGK